jgi:hypothetical protein
MCSQLPHRRAARVPPAPTSLPDTHPHTTRPQELHNLAWAIAAARQDRSTISTVIQALLAAPVGLAGLPGSGLANLLWAAAEAHCHHTQFFGAAAAALLRAGPGQLGAQVGAKARIQPCKHHWQLRILN